MQSLDASRASKPSDCDGEPLLEEQKRPSVPTEARCAKLWIAALLLAAVCMAGMNGYLLVSRRQDADAKDAAMWGIGIVASFLGAIPLLTVPSSAASPTLLRLAEKQGELFAKHRLISTPRLIWEWAPCLAPFSFLTIAAYFFVHIQGEWTPEMFFMENLGYALAGPAYCSLLLYQMARSYAVVDIELSALIARMEVEDDIDWDAFSATIHCTSRDMDRLFDVFEAGGVWCFAVALNCAICAFGVVLVVTGMHNSIILTVGGCWFFGGAFSTTVLLLPLAMLTTKCIAPTGAKKSLLMTAQDYPAHSIIGGDEGPRLGRTRSNSISIDGGEGARVLRMTENQKAAHHRFTRQLEAGTMGAKLCGVLVTPALIIKNFVKVAIALPTVYACLVKMLKSP